MLRDMLRRKHARLPRALSHASAESAFDEAIKLLQENGLVDIRNRGDDTIIYAVPEGARLALDYYKNGVLHAFVPEAIVATALLVETHGDQHTTSVSRVRLRDRARRLSRLLKHEFVFRPGVQFDALFDDAVEILAQHGIVRVVEGEVVIEPRRRSDVRLFAGLVQNFVEAYAIAAQGLALLRQGAMPQRALLSATLEVAQRAFLTGEVARAEAASKLIFENALQYFRDEGVLTTAPDEESDKGDKSAVCLSHAFAQPGAIEALEQQIRSLLPRPE
jgi:glycerol-3-phosphate O-acyltransferase